MDSGPVLQDRAKGFCPSKSEVMSKVKGCNYRVVRKATGEVVVAIEHGKVSAV